jgi:hypothetical protein
VVFFVTAFLLCFGFAAGLTYFTPMGIFSF